MSRRTVQINRPKDLYAGLIYIVVGVVTFIGAHQYEMGSAFHMGPGYFPALLGVVLVGLGVGAIVKGYRSTTSDPIVTHRLEPLLLVLASIVSFAFLIERTGLVLAIFVSVFLVCLRRAVTNPLEVFLTFALLALFCAVVFVYMFGMAIPLFWWSR
jgi:putative tricarboxylic transport membrane protein